MRKGVQASSVLVLDEGNPHIRSTRDGTATNLDVNSCVYTMDKWVCLDGTGPVFTWWRQGVACVPSAGEFLQM